jgi:acetyl esterase/lipase
MQAMRFVRGNAQRYGIESNRVGMLGFSAGGITTLRVLQDADASARPNIAASLYGLLWDQKVRPGSTPMFIAVAQDDPAAKDAKAIHTRWQQGGAPSELHIFRSGGHGFGLGRIGTESLKFPALFELWLRKQGFITASGKVANATDGTN